MKKIIASVLSLCIILSTIFTALVISAQGEVVENIITTKQIDLSLTDRLVYKNADNSTNTAIKDFTPGKTVTMVVQNNSVSGVPVGGNEAKEYSKQITLECAEGENYSGYFKVEEGKNYTVNVQFAAKATNSSKKLQVALVAANTPDGNDSTAVTLAGKEFTNINTWNTNQVLSAVIDQNNTLASPGDYLRIFLAGHGEVAIQSVVIEEIATTDRDKVITVNYNDGFCTRKQFTTKDAHIVPQFYGAADSVFDAWYTGSNFATKSNKPNENETYYARWLSLTRELDLTTANRMSGSNNAENDHLLKLTPATKSSNMKVVVNASTVNNYWPDSNSPNHFADQKQHISLEYFDLDTLKQDGVYDGYVKVESGKKYIFRVKYNATAINNKVQMFMVANESNLSWKQRTPIVGSKEIWGTGAGELSGIFSVGHGGAKANDKIRLGFSGNGTIEIKSITIQEIYESDLNSGNAVDININENGSTYRYYTVKNGDNWVMPNVAKPKGNVTKLEDMVWCSDEGLTTPMATPVSRATYYPKWPSITRELDLKNSNRMVYWDGSKNAVYEDGSGLNFAPATDSAPMTVTVDGNNIDSVTQHISLEYYDEDGKASNVQDADMSGYVSVASGKLYAVTVKYKAISIGATAPTIAILNSAKGITWSSGQKQLASATVNTKGEYVLSQIIGAGIDDCVAGDKLRLAFNGNGTFEISSVTITEIYPSVDVKPVVYKDGLNSEAYFATDDDGLISPAQKEGYSFEGWYDSSNNHITSISQITQTAKATVLTPKWLQSSTVYDIDLTKTQILKDKQGDTSTTVMTINPDAQNNDLTVELNSGWNNIFINNDGNINSGALWPDALLALKFSDGTDPEDFVKLQKDYKYTLNVEYRVVSASAEYNPQIAIVKNNAQNSSGLNGSVVLNASTHGAPGKYSISAVMSDIDNVPLRLAFGGVGEIKITSVKLNLEQKRDDTIIPITYINGESNYAKFQKLNSSLDIPVNDGFEFVGWYDLNGQKYDDINGVTTPLTLKAKWTGVKDSEIDLTQSEVLKDKNGSDSVVMELSPNADDKSLAVKLGSGWNNIFKDTDGNLRTGDLYPDAVVALKYDGGTAPASYIKLQNNYKYIINIEYEVVSADGEYNPQIALVRNKNTNSTGLNGTVVLNSNTHNTAGEYKLSAVVSDINNIPLRLAFGGMGKVVIKKAVISQIMAEDDLLFDITYNDKQTNYALFRSENQDLNIPVKDGFVFDGWFNKEGEKVEDIKGIKKSLSLFAKWTGIKLTEVDLSKSEALKDSNGSGENIMQTTVNDDKSLGIKLASGWNNIFKDADGNLRTGDLYPDAVVALKCDDSTEPTSYIKLQKDYKYAINVEYEVVSADSSYNPQIAIVRNKTQNSAGLNGAYVLGANTHSNAGEYKLSAVVSDINNIPLRLAFGGIGEIVIKKITISQIIADDENYLAVTYYDEESNFAVFQNPDSDLYTPDDDGFEFLGWFDINGQKKENLIGVTDSLTVYAKWTGVKSFEINPSDSEALRFKGNSGNTVLEATSDKSKNAIELNLNSGWNNIFRDKSGNLRRKTRNSDGSYLTALLWPDAILALKVDDNDAPASYLRAEKKYKYVLNIDYSVSSVYADFAPQIAIVKNAQTNSKGINGSIVLNSNTHLEKGDYSISAYLDNTDNIPLRLAFGGIGKIVIKKITISYINAKDQTYNPVMYVDGDSNTSEFLKKGKNLSAPQNTEGFKGWYKNVECIGKPITKVDDAATVYAKRILSAYSFDIDFDTKAQKDYYKQGNHTLSDFDTLGAKSKIVKDAGTNGSDAVRLGYKRLDTDFTDYAANPMVSLYDTNVTDGEIVDKRFAGKANTQYMVTFKYKVEETAGQSLELYVGKRNRWQASNGNAGGLNDFGTGAWQIMDATKVGSTITNKSDKWVEAKAYFTATSNWFPIILLKTNNQTKAADSKGKLASVLIDDITVTEIVSITEDTVLGVMDYENYKAKTYESSSADGLIGNKYALTVTNKKNHTKKGKNALELTVLSDSLQYSGNGVIAIKKEPIRTERNAAYIVEFYVMSTKKIDGLIWGVNSVAGNYDDITSNHKIEIRDKVDLKANKWQKITAYIPKLQGFADKNGLLSIALAANGYDGTKVYVDDITVKLQIESQVVNLVDSDRENPFNPKAQRGFKGQKLNTLPSVEKDGYFFDGWYDTAECDGKEYKVSDIFPNESDEITLYAKWILADDIKATDFTAGSFDVSAYDKGVVPYENICETSENAIYGIENMDSTQSGAWVKDAGIYGNGTADFDGALTLANDTYSKYTDTDDRNAIALINKDGTRFAVKKGEKYSIKFDYINGGNVGTSYIQTIISTGNGYRGFGYGKDQGLKNIAVHGTDSDYKTYQEYFVADFTGFVYITFATRTDDSAPYRTLYHKIYLDNVEIKRDEEVKKVNFIADGKVYKVVYGKKGDSFPVFDAISGDERTTEFAGFYSDPEFKNRIETYKLTDEEIQNIYIKYKEVKYDTPSDFSKPITLGFEESKWLDDYYRQGKHMTYWFRGEENPEWQLMTGDKQNAYNGQNYIKLNGYTTYWNEAKFVLYDKANPSGTMLLEKGKTYRVKLMTRCEDKYDIPKLTLTLENPAKRYLLEENASVNLVGDEKEYENSYMCYTADIIVPETITYLPSLAIRKNRNDLQTLFIDKVFVEEIIDCKVKFEENGGTEIEDVTVQIHELIADPGMPFKDGYEFLGWFSDKKLTKAWDFDTMTVEGDITLYAKWKKAVADSTDTDTPIVDDVVIEQEAEPELESKVPTMLEGDDHEYPPVEKIEDEGISTWIIVLIVTGGVLILLAIGALIWWLVARKKRKN